MHQKKNPNNNNKYNSNNSLRRSNWLFKKNNGLDRVKESHNVMVGSTSETIGNYNDQEGESRNSEVVEINTPKKKEKNKVVVCWIKQWSSIFAYYTM